MVDRNYVSYVLLIFHAIARAQESTEVSRTHAKEGFLVVLIQQSHDL